MAFYLFFFFLLLLLPYILNNYKPKSDTNLKLYMKRFQKLICADLNTVRLEQVYVPAETVIV